MTEQAPYRSPLEGDTDLMQIIGQVVSRWAAVDTMLVDLVMLTCLCTRECAQVVVYSPSGAARIDAVRTLVNGSADLAAKDRIIVGLDQLKRIVGDRNAIVHGAPLRAGKEGKLTAIIRDIKPKRETVVVETEARRLVGAHLDQLGAITGDLWAAIYQDQNSALSGWRDAEAGK